MDVFGIIAVDSGRKDVYPFVKITFKIFILEIKGAYRRDK
jgi:hypothetical protein